MPIHIHWNTQNQSTILINITPEFNLTEWYSAIPGLCLMFNEVSHPVNTVLDLSTFDHLPFDLITALNTSNRRFHKNHTNQVAIVKPTFHTPMETLLRNTKMTTGTAVFTSIEDAMRAFNQAIRLANIS